jgi:hypothetical protein
MSWKETHRGYLLPSYNRNFVPAIGLGEDAGQLGGKDVVYQSSEAQDRGGLVNWGVSGASDYDRDGETHPGQRQLSRIPPSNWTGVSAICEEVNRRMDLLDKPARVTVPQHPLFPLLLHAFHRFLGLLHSLLLFLLHLHSHLLSSFRRLALVEMATATLSDAEGCWP